MWFWLQVENKLISILSHLPTDFRNCAVFCKFTAFANYLNFYVNTHLIYFSYFLGSRGKPQNSEVRSDRRCGAQFLAPNGLPGKCDARSDRYCCSKWGFCGPEAPEDFRYEDHCKCSTCIDFRTKQQKQKAEQSKHFSNLFTIISSNW